MSVRTWWRPWRPRGGSLHRLLLVWLLVPLWALVALITLVQVAQQVRHDAAAQDEALRAALADWPVAPPDTLPTAHGSTPVWYRESDLPGPTNDVPLPRRYVVAS